MWTNKMNLAYSTYYHKVRDTCSNQSRFFLQSTVKSTILSVSRNIYHSHKENARFNYNILTVRKKNEIKLYYQWTFFSFRDMGVPYLKSFNSYTL